MFSDAPLAFAFGAGMLAAFNPCGFALLPAYLGWFLGIDTSPDTPEEVQRPGVLRSLAVGGCVTIGFVGVFAVVGLLARQFSVAVEESFPYLTLGLGILMIPLGLFLLSGRQLKLRVLSVKRGPRDRTLPAVVLFGASYALVSLGCTLPTFLTPVAVTLNRDLASGVGFFVSYSVGLGLILVSLTLAIGLAKGSLVRHFRRVLPFVGRASGALLAVTGAYVTYYGWYEIEVVVRNNTDAPSGPVDWVTARTDDLVEWVDRTGETRIGVALASLLLVTIVTVLVRRADRGAVRR